MEKKSVRIFRVVAVSFASLVVLLVVLRLTNQWAMFEVPTNAMAPFIRRGDNVVVRGLHGLPKRGDVVTFTTEGISRIYTPDDKPQMYVKRVAGLPGDKLHFVDGRLQINDRPVSEYYDVTHIPYVLLDKAMGGTYVDLSKPYLVPADHVIALGDNSSNSSDSRVWGPLPVKNLRHLYWFHLKHGPAVEEKSPPR